MPVSTIKLDKDVFCDLDSRAKQERLLDSAVAMGLPVDRLQVL